MKDFFDLYPASQVSIERQEVWKCELIRIYGVILCKKTIRNIITNTNINNIRCTHI